MPSCYTPLVPPWPRPETPARRRWPAAGKCATAFTQFGEDVRHGDREELNKKDDEKLTTKARGAAQFRTLSTYEYWVAY